MPKETIPSQEPLQDEIVQIPGTPWHLPKHLTLPAQTDTDGRVWPCGAVRRVQELPLAALQEAGVVVRWRLPNGEEITPDVGALLVRARQVDIDRGYEPRFEGANPPEPEGKKPVEGQ